MSEDPRDRIAAIVAAAEVASGEADADDPVAVFRDLEEGAEFAHGDAPHPDHSAIDPPPSEHPPGEGEGRARPPEGAMGEDELDRRLAFFALTDLGNAERFVARFGDRFRFSAALGWLVWDGRRWDGKAGDAAVMLAEHDTARTIQAEAESIRETNLDFMIDARKGIRYSDRLAGWGRASEGAAHLSAIGRRASAMLAIDPADLDRDPFLINVENGTLEVRRDGDGDYVRFREHRRDDLITKLAPVTYDPEATAPVFSRFLAEVQPVDAMRRFLAQWLGLSLTGQPVQQLVFFYGKGRNGKSTLVDALAHVAGDYSETIPIETFLADGGARRGGQATPDLALLPGVRLLRTSEPDRGAKLAESLIKLVTGGEPIQARHLNRDYFRFTPQFKLTISGNYKPEIRGNDEGIWRRVVLVPWTVTVAEEAVDRSLPAKLLAEASGILNWMLDGLRDFLDHGLVLPEEVTAATAAYREESDPLGRFVKACVETDIGGRVQSSEMHRTFLAWAKANGEREWSANGFGRALREAGFRSKQSNVIWWLDVRLVMTAADFGDADAPAAGGPPAPASEADYDA